MTTGPAELADDFEVIRIMTKIVSAMRFDAIPAIAVLAHRKKNDGAAFTLRHLRSLVDEYDAAIAAFDAPLDDAPGLARDIARDYDAILAARLSKP